MQFLPLIKEFLQNCQPAEGISKRVEKAPNFINVVKEFPLSSSSWYAIVSIGGMIRNRTDRMITICSQRIKSGAGRYGVVMSIKYKE